MNDPIEALERQLQVAGTPPLPLRGYLLLLRRGSLPIAELSRELGLDRSEGYRLARSLRSLDLASCHGRPLTVSARGPPRVLAALHHQVLARRERLARVLKQLDQEPGIQGLGPWDFQRARPLRMAEGERRVTEAFEGIMELAQRQVDSFLYIEGAARPGNFARLRAAARARARGVRFRAVVEVTPENLPFFEQASTLGEMRHVPGLRYTRYYVIDGKGVLVLLLPLSRQPRRQSEVGIWVTSPELVKFFDLNFQRMFQVGKPLRKRVAELRRGFPADLPLDPRRLGGPLERLERVLGGLGTIFRTDGRGMDLAPSLEKLAGELSMSLAGRGVTREASLFRLRRDFVSRKLGRLSWDEGPRASIRWEGCPLCGPGGMPPSFCDQFLTSAVRATLGPGWQVSRSPSPGSGARGAHQVWTERIPRPGGPADRTGPD